MASDRGNLSRKMAAIVHADVTGSTALVQLDEVLAHKRINDAFSQFSQSIEHYGGTVHEIRGDALVAEFPRASDAVCAALAFQESHSQILAELDDEITPKIRIGVSLGEVIFADGQVTGAGVVLAQRVEQLADSGGLCITAAIHEALPQYMPFDQYDLGEQEVKGFEESVRVYRVGLKSGAVIPLPEKTQQPKASNTLGISAAIAAIVLVIAGGVTFWFQPWLPEEELASVQHMAFPLPDKPSIAVLPFANMSDDATQEYFVDGMTEDLITDLSNLSGLFVIARNSVFTYKNKAVKVKQVAEELGVRYVMEGSVRRAGNQVRINAQLIDATTGGHLWAKRYDGSLEDVFALQDQVTEKIVSALKIELTPVERSNAQSPKVGNTEAYDAYLKGHELFRRGTPKSYGRAIEHFGHAIELDPKYSRAYAALAAVYWNSARNGWSWELGLTYNDAASKSREYLKVAMKEPSPLAHQIASERAAFLRTRPDRALSEAQMAIALDSSDPAGHLAMAIALIKAKRPEEAVESTRRAMRLDPLYPSFYLRRLGRAQLADQQFETAATTLKSAIERNPQDEWAMVFLAAVYGHMGRREKAAATVKKADALRAELGKGALTWENVDAELYDSRYTETGSGGMKGDKGIVREGLQKAGVDRGFRWLPLVTTIEGDEGRCIGCTMGIHTLYEVGGATTINAETAKSLHERGVPFVEIEPRIWFRAHVPGARLMDWTFGELNERRLSQVVDRNAEVVISGQYYERNVANACAAAVTWGFTKVYYFAEGLQGWETAGYPIEQVE